MMTEIGVPTEGQLNSPDSDDESFVILGRSVTPQSYIDVDDDDQIDNLNTNVVEESMKLTETALSQLNSVNLELQSMPSHFQQTIESVLQVVQERTSSPSSSVDLGPDEVLHKVNLLLEENKKLKDSLRQNNSIMKNQYEMLVTWQEEVMKIHTMHKEKFEISKKFVENLKSSNANLQQELETSLETQKQLKKELKSLKSKTNIQETVSSSSSEQVTLLENCIDSLKKELAKEKSLHQKSIEVCRSKTREAETVQEILLEELKIMKANFNEQTAVRSINEQTAINEKAADHCNQAQVEALQKTIDELQKLNLEKESTIKQKSDEYLDFKILLEDHQQTIIDRNKLIQAKNTHIDSLESKIGRFERAALVDEEVMKQNCSNVERIQSQLLQVIAEKNEFAKKKEETEELLLKKCNNIDLVQSQLDQVIIEKNELTKKKEETEILLTKKCNEVERVQSQLEQVIIEKEKMEELLLKKGNYVQRIQSELEQVIIERNELTKQKEETGLLSKKIIGLNGTIEHLQQQIHAYKSDFDVEHRVKDELKIENTRINEDLKALQRLNQQLLDQVEHLKNENASGFVHVQPCEPTTFCCPICNFKFSDYQALENHVHRCMEVNSIF